MFIDEVEIEVRAGRGGDGRVSFLREKFVPRGGPDGGDGGDGGSVILRTDTGVNTLHHLAHATLQRAKDGVHGLGKNMAGRDGADCVVLVPVGTLVKDRETGATLKDLALPGDEVVIAKGGKGGRGNSHFATAVHQTPREAEPGEPGEARRLRLELKLVADAGLVGMPNAGKSTLLSRLSAARPKIADYPFTTLVPYLGIVEGGGYETLVLADLPGLIEGAHRGTGLGDRFLRHIERTRFLVHLVDCSPGAPTPPADAYRIIRGELSAYGRGLDGKMEIVVATKLDIPGADRERRALARSIGRPVLGISAATGLGLKRLVGALFKTRKALSPSS